MTTQQLPEKFIDRIKLLYSKNDIENILHSFGKDKSVVIRVNTLKSSQSQVTETFRTLNIDFDQVNWYQDAFILKNMSARQVTDLEIFKNGSIYIQSLSSMIPALVLEPLAGDKVLDMCAAPGSKTTQIAAIMNNQGEIIANDISRERLYKLKANLELQGVTNAMTTSMPGQRLWQKYKEYFDKVLLDAPCSMEGRFKTSDPSTYTDWSEKKITQMAKQQRWLLRSAISATKAGGIIVYSTCTLAPEENEGVIDWILEKEKGKVIIEDISLKIGNMTKGVTSWKDKKFNEDVSKSVRIHPGEIMEGFYIAKLRKIKSNM